MGNTSSCALVPKDSHVNNATNSKGGAYPQAMLQFTYTRAQQAIPASVHTSVSEFDPNSEIKLEQLCSIASNLYGVHTVVAIDSVASRRKEHLSDTNTGSSAALYKDIFTTEF